MSVSQKVLDAIQLLTTNSVQKAGYDKTIQAQILSCQDQSIGKYRCRYQDAIIYAYSNSPDVSYSKGSQVYILVPENDMSKEKTIVGTTDKLGLNYISVIQGDQAYEVIGNNGIISNDKYYLNTNNINYKYVIHPQIDPFLGDYIKQASSLIMGATFKTNIPPERRSQGHFGINFNLKFADPIITDQIITKTYTIDESNMTGQSYMLIFDTRQYVIFDNIDVENFIQVDSIQIFNKDFPNANGENTNQQITIEDEYDIQISKLEIKAAVRLPENQLNGLRINLVTLQGTIFSENAVQGSSKTITAQLMVKGKAVSSDQKIAFYWGRENASISPGSEYYNQYLGRRWKCLNGKNIIQQGNANQEAIINWTPAKDTFIFKLEDATAKDNKIKVAAVYDNTVVTKEINIKNYSRDIPEITISSDRGTTFQYGNVSKKLYPTLTCKINGKQESDYNYYWGCQPNGQVYQQLEQATEPADPNNPVQRVEGNKIYNVAVGQISQSTRFICSVERPNGAFLGTASIVLTNVTENPEFMLVFNNGSAVYQYNEKSQSPCRTYEPTIQPQIIQPLTFEIYDKNGQSIDISRTKIDIKWEIPYGSNNTLLVTDPQDNGGTHYINEQKTYQYYQGIDTLIYKIADRYNISAQQNRIKLTVVYKNITLTAETNFIFTKTGQSGTNGTDFVVRIIPNTYMSNPPLYPMITKAGNDYILNYGLENAQDQTIIEADYGLKLFRAQLWKNGELIWDSGQSIGGSEIGIKGISWEVLRNKYSYNLYDASAFEIEDSQNGIIKYIDTFNTSATPYANIIKCGIKFQEDDSISQKTYYGTIPIITAQVINNNYRIGIVDYTGFRYVLYSSDGTNPNYDSTRPFEYYCKFRESNDWTDISQSQNINYTISVLGDTFSHTEIIDEEQVNFYTPSRLLSLEIKGSTERISPSDSITTDKSGKIIREEKEKQVLITPASKYDGLCVNNMVCCQIKQNDTIIGKIRIPIHFLLNKYGLSHLNDWDGNSIQINENGGYILSPQMGAGYKDYENNFTGILMGEVKNPGTTMEESQIGLLGYNQGIRTFFLNSKNGSAIFGRADTTGGSQIIIDPYYGVDGMLYSGNFWRNYNGSSGLPSSYNQNNESGAGLLINLSKPQIRYGSGSFSVDQDGKLTATEATISGEITATSLTLGSNASIPWNKTNHPQFASVATSGNYNDLSNTPNLSNYISLDNFSDELNNAGVLRSSSITVDQTTGANGIITTTFKVNNVPSWTTYTADDEDYMLLAKPVGTRQQDYSGSYFKVSRNGLLEADNAFIHGTIYATNGQFTGVINAQDGGQIAGWDITSSQLRKSITSDGVTYRPFINAPSTATTDTIAFGVAKDSNYQFQVTYGGKLKAKDAEITGKIESGSGNIGGWSIGSTALQKFSAQPTTSGDQYNVFMQAPTTPNVSDSPSRAFSVQKRTFTNGTAGDWSNVFYVNYKGKLYAQDAEITGTISGSTITGSTISGTTISGGTINGTTITGEAINITATGNTTGSGNMAKYKVFIGTDTGHSSYGDFEYALISAGLTNASGTTYGTKGTLSVDPFGTISVDGDFTVSGGDATFYEDMSVTGEISCGKISSLGDVSAVGTVTSNGAICSGGKATVWDSNAGGIMTPSGVLSLRANSSTTPGLYVTAYGSTTTTYDAGFYYNATNTRWQANKQIYAPSFYATGRIDVGTTSVTGASTIHTITQGREIELVTQSSGTCGVYDITNSKWIANMSSSGVRGPVASTTENGFMSAADKTKLDALGTLLGTTTGSGGTVTVPGSSTWTKYGDLKFASAGLWLVIVMATFASNSTGRRGITIDKPGDGVYTPAAGTAIHTDIRPASATTYVRVVGLVSVAANEVYSINLWSSAGNDTSLTATVRYTCVRLRDN